MEESAEREPPVVSTAQMEMMMSQLEQLGITAPPRSRGGSVKEEQDDQQSLLALYRECAARGFITFTPAS